MAQSLEDMVEELTCSICLSLFSTPVTIPCGHNFCSQCLELTWKDSYTCPQCRCTFPTKPDLKKNTLLSNLVSMAQTAQGEETTGDHEEPEDKTHEESEEEEVGEEAVLCDSCRKNPASKTCLTCMASFCQDHLLPHLESPAFRDHQLILPLNDLQQRKCVEHNKLMDHYCWDHSKCICCYCALNHKPCQTYTLEEGKKRKELYYTNLLRSLNQKIDKAVNIAEEVCYEQRKVMKSAKKKEESLEAEFQEIMTLIDGERRKAMAKIEEEKNKSNSKFSFTHNVLSKKKKEFQFMRDKVQSLLQEQDDLQFLKRATKLRDTTSKEPYKPKIELDEKLLHLIYKNTISLKEAVKSKIKQPEEFNKEKPSYFSKEADKESHEKPSKKKETTEQKTQRPPEAEPTKPEEFNKEKPSYFSKEADNESHEKPSKKNKTQSFGHAHLTDRRPRPPDGKQRKAPHASPATLLDTREQLVNYAERLSADPHTAHKKIALCDGFTKMAVSDVILQYTDGPRRFVSCCQVLCTQAFSGGIHYWEVEKEEGHYSGLGVAYQSIARLGSESRLGRNKVSWCIEWCNGKLQAWHDDKHTDLTTPNTNKYGLLLNCDHGYVAFFCVGKKCSQIYKFNARFTEALYPAFWMFSNKTVLTLCQSYQLEA